MGSKILIAEDEEIISRELKTLLEQAGYQAVLAEDFQGLLPQIQREQPDLVLLDVNLPGCSGFDICAQIREHAAGTPVTSGNIGTGYRITTGGKTYIAVKKGDTNGDGNVNILDSVVILNAIKGERTLENEYKSAACTKNNSEFNVTDVVLLLNYIKGETSLGV